MIGVPELIVLPVSFLGSNQAEGERDCLSVREWSEKRDTRSGSVAMALLVAVAEGRRIDMAVVSDEQKGKGGGRDDDGYSDKNGRVDV